jgi:hypothetical protein
MRRIAIVLALVLTSAAYAKEKPSMSRATGTFDVKLTPAPAAESAEGATLGRMSIDKQFHGDIDGTSTGEMLTAMSKVEGSGVYVAVERVSATLKGRKGTFALHHTGVMTRGTPQLSITVVPDSGTGDLTGISGTMSIDIAADGTHSYTFDYSLP